MKTRNRQWNRQWKMTRKHKVIFVCGLIGSGKTTWARRHGKQITDLDDFPKWSTKQDQIKRTKQLLKSGPVYHITCYPTGEELRSFKACAKEFVLIATSRNQAKTNILIRARKRDLDNLGGVLKANESYWKLYRSSKLPFRTEAVFHE